MAEQIDPFSLVGNTLWTGIVEPSNPADRLVLGQARQRVRFDRPLTVNALKEAWGDGQTPLVAMMPGRLDVKLFSFDGDGLSMTLSHQLVYLGRTLDVTTNNLLKWYTLRALYRLGPVLGLPRLIPEPVRVRQAGDDFGGTSAWAGGDARVLTIWTVEVPVLIGADDVVAGTYPTTL